MRRIAREIQPTIGWPVERIAATGSFVLAAAGAATEIAHRANSFISDIEPNQTVLNGTGAAMFSGFIGAAVFHKIGQRRGTVRDRNYD